MYKTDFACTYKLMDNDEDSLILYQFQFLQAFNLQIFSDDIINSTTENIYEKYRENKYIKELIEKAKKTLSLANGLVLFKSYFGYDTFYLFHSILCSLINNKFKKIEIFNKLINS